MIVIRGIRYYTVRKLHSIKIVFQLFFQINRSFSTTEEIMVSDWTIPFKKFVFNVTEDKFPQVYVGLLF